MNKHKTLQQLYPRYFGLNINQRINARQARNGLNICSLFSATIHTITYQNAADFEQPYINNGLYHHPGRTHQQYPGRLYGCLFGGAARGRIASVVDCGSIAYIV